MDADTAADTLVGLYERAFGGKERGRYRIAGKVLRELLGRRRLYEDDIKMLSRALYQRGFILIDLDSFFVVVSAGTFTNYRRANRECLNEENTAQAAR